jgi:hypothetical protein
MSKNNNGDKSGNLPTTSTQKVRIGGENEPVKNVMDVMKAQFENFSLFLFFVLRFGF